jgi:hypothetical protein
MNYAKIAERYGVTLEEAEQLRSHIDSKNFLDWSQASYAEIDRAMHHAGCAVLGRAVCNREEAARRGAGMAGFRAKLAKAHKEMLAGGDPNTKRSDATGEAARKYHASVVETIERAQKKFGEA